MICLRPAAWSVLALTLAATACSKNPPPEVAPIPEAAPTRPATDDAAARAAADRAAREAADRAARDEVERLKTTLEELIFFDYDVSAIRPDAVSLLNAKAGILRNQNGVRLTIEGHADERGSTEYNLALGNRRANAVKEFLVGHGLEASRFNTVSFGEERPLAQGTAESAWSRNRRAAFRVEAGLTTPPNPSPATAPTGGGGDPR